MAPEIHVLLTEHDASSHCSIKKMLEYFSYKVTSAKLASTALSILSKGKFEFDMLLVNINSPDSCGLKLVQDAIKLDLPVFLITDEEDATMAKRALQEGAVLYIKKPVVIETIKQLDQYVWRMNIRARQIEEIVENKLQKELEGETSMNSNIVNIDNGVGEEYKLKNKKKPRTRWTQELHDKFVKAVQQLGEGGCYPQDILELMNVPGLTRMQVASHLQRCREGIWRPPKERNLKAFQKVNPLKRPKIRSGLMPHLGNKLQPQLPIQENQEDVHNDPSIQNAIVLGAGEQAGSANAEGYRPFFHEDHNSFPFDLAALQLKRLGLLPCNIDDVVIPTVPFQFGA